MNTIAAATVVAIVVEPDVNCRGASNEAKEGLGEEHIERTVKYVIDRRIEGKN